MSLQKRRKGKLVNIRVDEDFNRKLNIGKYIGGFQSIPDLTREMARDDSLEQYILRLKEKKKRNGLFD